MNLLATLKPIMSNRSLVSENDRVRYVDGNTCLTIWYDHQKEIIAFEVIFGLIVDEWAFLYHRSGTVRYCKVDDGHTRFGRHQKQAMYGDYKLPAIRLKEFETFNGDVPNQEKYFVLNIMKTNFVK